MMILCRTQFLTWCSRRKNFTKRSLFEVVFVFISIIIILDISGVYIQLAEKDYAKEFSWSLESPDFVEIVKSFRNKNPNSIAPINTLYSEISWLNTNQVKCETSLDLLILVKSAPKNRKNREAIRLTFQKPTPGISSKTVFFVGKSKDDQDLQLESQTFKDIVEINFIDSYYNNTIKTMVEMRWAVEDCSNFKHVLLVDDDYFVSVKNLHRFTMEHESNYERLYAGYTMFPKPLRHKIFNKWFVSLEEYPYSRFPPYVTAGAILLSKTALMNIYYASFFLKHFRFDDIYVALCAKKMGLVPIHSEEFRFHETTSESPEKDLIVSHGFRDPEKLVRFWRIQSQYGFV